jgi:hypothetical protein
MESQVFTNVLRAQVNTAGFKPCTYFATYENRSVFVKGPFATKADASIAMLVSRFKLMLADLQVPQGILVELIPDGMNDCKLGLRLRLDRTKPHWFQVNDDLLGGVHHSKVKTTLKAWTSPVNVVDWSKGVVSHVAYSKDESKSIYVTNPVAAISLVKHVFLSWVCGSGADLAYSNFLLIGDDVVQVDCDNFGRFDWDITSSQIASNKTQAALQMEKFVRARLLLFKDFFGNAIQRASQLKNMLVEYDREAAFPIIMARLETLQMDPLAPFAGKKVEENVEPLPLPLPKKVDTPTHIGLASAKYHSEKDFWGHSLTVRKSDIQKAIRRGMEDQALVAFFAGWNLVELFPGETRAKAMRTNFINRVIICICEDIGVANIALVRLAISINTKTVTASNMYQLVVAACRSPKTRIMSHLTHRYAKINCPEPDPYSDEASLFSILSKPTGHAELWTLMGSEFKPLYTLYKRMAKTNQRAIIQCAVTWYLYTRPSAENNRKSWIENSVVDPVQIDNNKLELLLTNSIDMSPQECAFDMHVTGNRSVENKRIFRTEGSKITNECSLFADEELKKAYENSKL